MTSKTEYNEYREKTTDKLAENYKEGI